MANVKFPTGKPSDSNGTGKSYRDGNPASGISNVGGDKGAKIIGNAKNASAGKLKTYKTSVAGLNKGAFTQMGMGGKTGLDRADS
jgi:hypothetical protein